MIFMVMINMIVVWELKVIFYLSYSQDVKLPKIRSRQYYIPQNYCTIFYPPIYNKINCINQPYMIFMNKKYIFEFTPIT